MGWLVPSSNIVMGKILALLWGRGFCHTSAWICFGVFRVKSLVPINFNFPGNSFCRKHVSSRWVYSI